MKSNPIQSRGEPVRQLSQMLFVILGEDRAKSKLYANLQENFCDRPKLMFLPVQKVTIEQSATLYNTSLSKSRGRDTT
jgi:hypothetical protein